VCALLQEFYTPPGVESGMGAAAAAAAAVEPRFDEL
jgi:hypothetical protein